MLKSKSTTAPLTEANHQDEENIIELEEDWGDEFNNVVTILCGLHLNQYVDIFVSQGINEDIFFNLNEDDLCHIGITSSKDRKALLQGISQLTRTKAKLSSEVCLANLSPEEVSTILTSTVKHLTVIHASLAHTRLALRHPSVHNSLINLKLSSAELLELLGGKANIQAQLLINLLNGFLTKKPAVKKSSKGNWTFHITIVSSVSVLCAVLFCVKKMLKVP